MSDQSDFSASDSADNSRPRVRSTRWGTTEGAQSSGRMDGERASSRGVDDGGRLGRSGSQAYRGDREVRRSGDQSSGDSGWGGSGRGAAYARGRDGESRSGFKKRNDRNSRDFVRGDRQERRGDRGDYGRRDSRGGSGQGSDRSSSAHRSDRDADASAQRGPRSWDSHGDEKAKRQPEPPLPESITGQELDKDVRQQLRTLSKDNADGVAKHLVAVAEFLDDDPERALLHAQHVVSRAARVPAAREALGLVLYRSGEFAEALREFRTARRLSGSDHLLPYMVDCERGLGRYERALELANSPEAQRLSENDNIELAIVVSGVRRDMGQARAAVVGLRIPALKKATTQSWAARLFYAYADALLDIDEVAEARQWFVKADKVDVDGETDAADRIDQIDGFEMSDLTPEEDEVLDPRLAEIDLSKPFGSPRSGAQGDAP